MENRTLVGERMHLKNDVKFRGKLWGKKGEQVTVVSVSGSAVIYQNKKGDRYPCNIKDIE